MHKKTKSTSWQKVAPWYNKITNEGKGHYYHEQVIIPGVLRLLSLSPVSNLLDLACGNGVLARSLPKGVKYTGIDLSENLIKTAKNEDINYNHKYLVADITKPLNLPEKFSHATIVLSLQNISDPVGALKNASNFLIANGYLLIVLNHPAFRIPRQSSWGIDMERKIQYRRVDRYMSPMEIPVNPETFTSSGRNSALTISYHFPISYYINALRNSGFLIENIEEWTSDKESFGRNGRMENRSRNEIPLFMAILAVKK